MLRMNPAMLQTALKQLEQAVRGHASWHEKLLETIVCRLPGDPNDLAENAHERCDFGQWFYLRAPEDLRKQPAFAAIGREHERLHRIGARLLRAAADGAPIARADYEELAAANTRLRLEVDSLRHEIEGALRDRDALTGAYGRVDMLSELREWRELAKRDVQPCCIVFMDVDHLKEINDTYGHAAGDGVLAGAVKFLIEHLRPYDKVFRYGGDEFLISLPGADLAAGQSVIRHIRFGLERTPLFAAPGGTAIHATASFGLALLETDVSVEECIDRADQALLLAKAAGRNHAITWDSSVTTGRQLKRLQIEGATD
jgi:diguanylate cyclase